MGAPGVESRGVGRPTPLVHSLAIPPAQFSRYPSRYVPHCSSCLGGDFAIS